MTTAAKGSYKKTTKSAKVYVTVKDTRRVMPLKVRVSSSTVKGRKLKFGSQSFKGVLAVSGIPASKAGKVTYAVSGDKSQLSLSGNTVTVARGTPARKNPYSLKVTVRYPGDEDYKEASETATIKVSVTEAGLAGQLTVSLYSGEGDETAEAEGYFYGYDSAWETLNRADGRDDNGLVGFMWLPEGTDFDAQVAALSGREIVTSLGTSGAGGTFSLRSCLSEGAGAPIRLGRDKGFFGRLSLGADDDATVDDVAYLLAQKDLVEELGDGEGGTFAIESCLSESAGQQLFLDASTGALVLRAADPDGGDAAEGLPEPLAWELERAEANPGEPVCWTLREQVTGRHLAAASLAGGPDGTLLLTAEDDDWTTHWCLFRSADGAALELVNTASGFVLDVTGAAAADGAAVGSLGRNDWASQQWTLVAL